MVARLESVPRPPADTLTPGDVAIDVAWSDINFKDALAVTGAGKIMRARR